MSEEFPWRSHRSMDRVTESEQLADRIKPILAGHSPDAQGAALAVCVAIWLAGHGVTGNQANTEKLRADLLKNLWDFVRELVPIYEKILRPLQ